MPEDERDGVPDATIDRERSKARQMLEDATKASEVGISKGTVVNRLYYACFHAAQAALYARGFDPQSHGRVQTLLGQEFVKTGDVPRELGRFFNDIGTYRRRVDYGTGGVERETEWLLERTRTFLTEMERLTTVDPEDGN